MVDVSLQSVQDVSAFQWVGSESETICLGIPGAEEQSESPHRHQHVKEGERHKGHGLKHAAQMPPPMER